jgi:excisionase family DNA binding protein
MTGAMKSKSKRVHRNMPALVANGPLVEVLTLPEAAAYLRLSEKQVLQLVDEQGLPARQLGHERRFLKSAIQHWLSRGIASAANKAAQIAVAGSWKNDPLVNEELLETYRRRGRSMTREKS